jgi:hypothetical protein
MSIKSSQYKKCGKGTYLPFWYGNKFIKRLQQKRIRQAGEKQNVL